MDRLLSTAVARLVPKTTAVSGKTRLFSEATAPQDEARPYEFFRVGPVNLTRDAPLPSTPAGRTPAKAGPVARIVGRQSTRLRAVGVDRPPLFHRPSRSSSRGPRG